MLFNFGIFGIHVYLELFYVVDQSIDIYMNQSINVSIYE